MKKMTLVGCCILIFLSACNGGSPSSSNKKEEVQKPKEGSVSEWQTSFLGQEGHGGDAIVCFSIPVEQALYQVKYGQESACTGEGPCYQEGHTESGSLEASSDGKTSSGTTSGTTWRMTDEGRKSIHSAKPLEQYLAERIASKKPLIDQLNQMSLEEGYQQSLLSFAKLPAAFQKLSSVHQRLGWLKEDGIASEYGLLDVNDSGFVNENEIDKTHCKELQAVVRRDNQLWYDADIVNHFDIAGQVLIQLHEEIYAWGKDQDSMNRQNGRFAHDTSVKTRRLILKILDDNLDEKQLNENLKSLGFTIMYWETGFKVPTSTGYYMDSESCVSEQKFLNQFLQSAATQRDFWLNVRGLFADRYLEGGSMSEFSYFLHYNFPEALSHMIALTMNGDSPTYAAEMMQLQSIFERPESCLGSF